MFLQKLSLINFKNYSQAELSFSNNINCFTGNNGEGKTNLLDAIYYLSFCKSFFNPIDSQNVKHEMPFFVIQGQYQVDGKSEAVYCGLKRQEKKQFKRNQKEYDRLADHIGLFPLVMISPSDSELVNEGSEVRRKFMDGVISQVDKQYLDNLISYNRALSQRNSLLKTFAEARFFDVDALEIWNSQLVSLGEPLHEKRAKFIDEFILIFQKYYDLITAGKEEVNLIYDSQLNGHDFKTLLQQSVAKDRQAQYSTIGIHKDDLLFNIKGYPVKKFGSQGQQKSFLIALKLAEFDFIRGVKHLTPILLLDDIYDKLDENRVRQLIKLVSGNDFGQIFITDTHYDRIQSILTDLQTEFKLFGISDGNAESLN